MDPSQWQHSFASSLEADLFAELDADSNTQHEDAPNSDSDEEEEEDTKQRQPWPWACVLDFEAVRQSVGPDTWIYEITEFPVVLMSTSSLEVCPPPPQPRG